MSRGIGWNALPTTTVCPPSAAPTLAPSISPTTLAPSYLPGNPTPKPSPIPTSPPSATIVICRNDGGYGCCGLCGNGFCTMTFSKAVSYIGYKYQLLYLILLIIFDH